MRPLYLRVNVLKTKNARWPVVHIPLALMSSLGSEDLLAVLGMSVSPDNAERIVSTQTSLHISPRRIAVIFRSSLCRYITNLCVFSSAHFCDLTCNGGALPGDE